jgi:hypothetical protein
MIRHSFEWCLRDESCSGRVACFRKIKQIPFLVPAGLKLEIAGCLGANLHAEEVRLNVDTGDVSVDVTWRDGNTSESDIYEMGRELLDYGWELWWEDNPSGMAPFAEMEKPKQ